MNINTQGASILTLTATSSNKELVIPQIWKEACQRYTVLTGRHLESESYGNSRTIGSIEDVKILVSNHHDQFASFLEKKPKLWRYLDQTARFIELCASIVRDASSMTTTFLPASFLFEAIVHLLRAAKRVATKYDSVIKLLHMFQDFFVRVHIHALHDISDELREIIANKLCSLLVIFGISTRMIRNGRTLNFFKTVVKGHDHDGLQEQIDELERLAKAELLLVQTLTLQVSHDHSSTLIAIGTGISTVQALTSGINGALGIVAKDIVKIKESIEGHRLDGEKPFNPELQELSKHLLPEFSVETFFDNVSNKVLDGTGNWILEDPAFLDWLGPTSSCVCISGGPGEGKTYLAARIIQHLQVLYPQSTVERCHTSVPLFFCRADTPQTQSFSALLRTVAYQVARSNSNYRTYLTNTLDFEALCHAGMAKLFSRLFADFFLDANEDSRAFVVIDGVDEATQSGHDGLETFMELLEAFLLRSQAMGTSRLKFLILGRHQIDERISDSPSGLIAWLVMSQRYTSDVELFVRDRLSRHPKLRRLSAAFKHELHEAFLDKTFFWVSVVCDEMARKPYESQMREVLRSFPRGLQRAIRLLLERFSESEDLDGTAALNELLKWVVCARRPLTLVEIGDIMRMHSSSSEPILYLERLLRTRWSTFFLLMRSDGLSTEQLRARSIHICGDVNGCTDSDLHDEDLIYNSPPRTTKVLISHVSFSRYFQETSNPCTPVGIDLALAERHLLGQCLALIAESPTSQWNDSALQGKYALSRRFYWVAHLRACNRQSVSVEQKCAIVKSVRQMFIDTHVLLRWSRICSGWNYLHREFLDTFVAETGPTSAMAVLYDWIDDPDVAETIPLDGDYILVPAMSMFAHQWLERAYPLHQLTRETIFPPFEALYLYISKEIAVDSSLSYCGRCIAQAPTFDPRNALYPDVQYVTANIISAARWTGVVPTFRWYIGVALVFDSLAEPHVDDLYWYRCALSTASTTQDRLFVLRNLAHGYARCEKFHEALRFGRRYQSEVYVFDGLDLFWSDFTLDFCSWAVSAVERNEMTGPEAARILSRTELHLGFGNRKERVVLHALLQLGCPNIAITLIRNSYEEDVAADCANLSQLEDSIIGMVDQSPEEYEWLDMLCQVARDSGSIGWLMELVCSLKEQLQIFCPGTSNCRLSYLISQIGLITLDTLSRNDTGFP